MPWRLRLITISPNKGSLFCYRLRHLGTLVQGLVENLVHTTKLGNAYLCVTCLSVIVAIWCTYALVVVGALLQANLTCHTLISSSSSTFLWLAGPAQSGLCVGSAVVSARVIVANPCIFHFVRLFTSRRLQNATSPRRILLCFPRRLD